MGGTASSSLRPPQSSLRQENVTVFGCLTHEVPLSLGDAAVTCSKGEDEEAGRERRLVVPSRGRVEEGWARLGSRGSGPAQVSEDSLPFSPGP